MTSRPMGGLLPASGLFMLARPCVSVTITQVCAYSIMTHICSYEPHCFLPFVSCRLAARVLIVCFPFVIPDRFLVTSDFLFGHSYSSFPAFMDERIQRTLQPNPYPQEPAGCCKKVLFPPSVCSKALGKKNRLSGLRRFHTEFICPGGGEKT
jgi:hypothetical protein